MSELFADLPVRQIAYFVADLRAAAAAHRRVFGSGPFLVVDHVPTPIAQYRGAPAVFDHGSAYGQWGDVMVEFSCQHNPDPSAFHDMYPWGSGRYGLHHVAVFVDDLHEGIARFEALGHPCALYAEVGANAYAMVDTVALLGHMTELYVPNADLTGFYDRIRAAARADGPDFID